MSYKGIYTCDRCKKEVSLLDGDKERQKNIFCLQDYWDKVNTPNIHLCRKCYLKFKKFLKVEKEVTK